jgi:hypothetical protein
MANAYDRGDLVRVVATFVNSVSVTQDPATVVMRILAPGTSVVTWVYGAGSVVRDATGAYHVDVNLIGAPCGDWTYRFDGLGSGQAAGETTFNVKFTGFL